MLAQKSSTIRSTISQKRLEDESVVRPPNCMGSCNVSCSAPSANRSDPKWRMRISVPRRAAYAHPRADQGSQADPLPQCGPEAVSSECCESLWRPLSDPSLHGSLWCPVTKAEARSVIQLRGDAFELVGGPGVEVGPLREVLP